MVNRHRSCNGTGWRRRLWLSGLVKEDDTTVIKSLLPAPVATALEACKPHLAAAALFSALINILYLAPTIYMMQVYDRVVPTGGVITLFWITAVLAVAIATLTEQP